MFADGATGSGASEIDVETSASLCTWTLTPEGSGTQVRMEQTGFRPHEELNRRGAKMGFTQFLEGLERVAGTL